jgi:circadian clock protein KaiC
METSSTPSYCSSGIQGLDDVLHGGFYRERLYLIEGAPGAGKTTLALQFLMNGAALNETVLYITLSESRTELESIAASHGWSLAGIRIQEVLPSENILNPEEQYTIFHPSDVEMGQTTREILAVVEEVRPNRIVLDSLSELQLLAANSLVYRRQVLALKQLFAGKRSTTLFLDDLTTSGGGEHVRSIAHGVVTLERMRSDYGGIRRRLEVIKYRGQEFREGLHDYRIKRGGIIVYRRLVASETREMMPRKVFKCAVAGLNEILGGGIEEGSSTLIAGPAGVGKSTLSMHFVDACLNQGWRAAIFLFEESASNLLNRADSMNLRLRSHLEPELLGLWQIDPAQLIPGEFVSMVCSAADLGAKVVVIDSLNGFLQSMPNEKLLVTHLHELLTYLGQRGVVTLLVGVQQGMLSGAMTTAVDASYLSDNVILLRYFESQGEIRQAISIFKKRGGAHERTIRQMTLTSAGIVIGPALRNFQGILTGVPRMLSGQQDTHDQS